ncbi:uncharacterized protein LOC131237262 isoform X2 [Magnolia sinica]|uniref:uncharacterized protein LOC131237262 isoform X2 n=1 Tax=Magnolia sinica TaxID=86752 RepID=UPI00265A3C2E|nr:uncharacterized protein LOC131237262 isoform X2 [Magnolia sinica]
MLTGVTCILIWATYNQNPSCPQCKHPFQFLGVHRSLDGRRLRKIISILSSDQPPCPQLYLYSTTDKVIPARSAESFIQEQKKSGRNVKPNAMVKDTAFLGHRSLIISNRLQSSYHEEKGDHFKGKRPACLLHLPSQTRCLHKDW